MMVVVVAELEARMMMMVADNKVAEPVAGVVEVHTMAVVDNKPDEAVAVSYIHLKII